MKIFDEVSKFWLPWNQITREIKHDMRFIISMPQEKPWVYQISKVNNIDNKGVIEFTLKQTEFNQFTDYVNLDPNNIEMYANYYKSNIIPEDEKEIVPNDSNTLEIISGDYYIMLGFEKTVMVEMKDSNGETVKDVIPSQYSWEISKVISETEEGIEVERIDSNTDFIPYITPLNSDILTFIIADKTRYNKNIINITCTYNDGDNTITTSKMFTTKKKLLY